MCPASFSGAKFFLCSHSSSISVDAGPCDGLILLVVVDPDVDHVLDELVGLAKVGDAGPAYLEHAVGVCRHGVTIYNLELLLGAEILPESF